MSLVGQCRWDIDVVWGGRSGLCGDAPARWGGWLAGAIVRFVVTLLFLIVCHWLTWLIGSDGRTHSSASGHRPRSQSTASLMNSNRTKRGRQASQPNPYPASSASSSQDHRRTFSSSNTAHAQSPSSLTYVPNHLTRAAQSPSSVTKSPSKGMSDEATARPSGSSNSHDQPAGRLSPTSDISDYYSDVEDGGDLNRFAANFRTLVDRVSRETDDGARLPAAPIYNLTRPPLVSRTTPPYPPRRSPSPRNSSSRRSSFAQETNGGAGPSSPTAQGSSSSIHQVNEIESSRAHRDAQMQHDLLQAHRLMLLEQAMRAESYEHIVVLGGAVRRMSTIASVADPSERGEPPWTPTSGASSYMTPMDLTRSPTSSTARSGRRNPMSRHAITPPPGNVGMMGDSYHSERGNYTD
ncbi:hypothetical protein FRB90_007848 [Tulasnella sp. 427]|nr:hypothetical protein FRB90_007848 [Tulasnella sp. 427]